MLVIHRGGVYFFWNKPFLGIFMEIFRGKFYWKTFGKKQPISQEFSGQISLETNWFCPDLMNVFNEKRRQCCQFFFGK